MLSPLLEPAPVISLKVLAGLFDKHTGSGKLPRMVAEKFLAQLILLVFDFDRLEHAACLLRLDAFLLDFEDGLRPRCARNSLQALANQLVLLRSVPHQDLSGGDIVHYIKPFGCLTKFAGGLLCHSDLANPEGREVIFAHRELDAAARRPCRISGEERTDPESNKSDRGMKQKAGGMIN